LCPGLGPISSHDRITYTDQGPEHTTNNWAALGSVSLFAKATNRVRESWWRGYAMQIVRERWWAGRKAVLNFPLPVASSKASASPCCHMQIIKVVEAEGPLEAAGEHALCTPWPKKSPAAPCGCRWPECDRCESQSEHASGIRAKTCRPGEAGRPLCCRRCWGEVERSCVLLNPIVQWERGLQPPAPRLASADLTFLMVPVDWGGGTYPSLVFLIPCLGYEACDNNHIATTSVFAQLGCCR
jgi:hypothetical protein